MNNLPILSILTFLPILGALFLVLVHKKDEVLAAKNARSVALFVSLVNLGISIFLVRAFDVTTSAMQFVEKYTWIESFNIHYTMGVDGISILFVLLTALLTPICILVSWESISKRVVSYMACFLALEGAVIGVFCALDMVLFYFFWEAMLIPMFLIIGVWGGENRVYAALKFFLYTFVGSVLMLVALMYMYFAGGHTFDVLALQNTVFSVAEQKWLWVAFFLAFAVKVPMWPFHTWLPDAHVQAPTAGSVILAGILLKMGAYGFLRFSIPMFPEASAYFTPMVMTLSVIAIVYTALVAFAQTDVKKLIAYSSVSHMGFVTLGIFAATEESTQGAVLQMFNHGVVSSALFMLVGVVYDRMHTRDIDRFGGIVNRMPIYAAVMMLFTMASVGLPGTNSFVGEVLVLMGSYEVAQWHTVVATTGVLLGAVYMLSLYKRMVMGEPKSHEIMRLRRMSTRERGMFVPLIILVLWIGLFPNYWLGVMETSVGSFVTTYSEIKADMAPAVAHADVVQEKH